MLVTAYVDTNILVRLLTNDIPEQAEAALRLIDEHGSVHITSSTMLETSYVLITHYTRIRANIVASLTDLLKSHQFIVDEALVWRLALELFGSTTLALHHCYIAARALSEGATLLTFDEDLEMVMQRKHAEG
jgi:predicted nucleic-acid-binding protein